MFFIIPGYYNSDISTPLAGLHPTNSTFQEMKTLSEATPRTHYTFAAPNPLAGLRPASHSYFSRDEK
jgi:hypothetical protein